MKEFNAVTSHIKPDTPLKIKVIGKNRNKKQIGNKF